MPDDPSGSGPAALPRPVRFLDIDFTPLDPAGLLAAVTAAAGDGAGRPGRFGYVVTPNVDHVVRLEASPELRPLYRNAWLTVCDSRILQTLAARSGLTLPACPGSDLTAAVLEHVIAPDEPVVVIGGDADLVAALAARYRLTRVHWHAPPMGLRRNPAAIAAAAAFMAAHPARFHFICVGSPQQEMVAEAARARGDARGVGLCVGASLEFLTGRTARAPLWMQRARLEWLHRLASEPGRMWKRYLVEGPRILGIWWRWQRRRRMAGPAAIGAR